MKTFIQRTKTGLILTAVILAIIFGPRWSLALLTLAISAVAILELDQAFKKQNIHMPIAIVLIADLILVGVTWRSHQSSVFYTLIFATMGLLIDYLVDARHRLIDVLAGLFALIYSGLFFSMMLWLPKEQQHMLYLIFISAWGTDTFAYIFGSLFGRHKLAPVISPKKSIEGAIGGTVGAMAFACAMQPFFFGGYSMWQIMLMTFVGSIMSQLGDLCASRIKREVRIKDYGNMFAGHGGALDRFDSVLFAVPTVVILINLLR